jgi:hypothetical protein
MQIIDISVGIPKKDILFFESTLIIKAYLI